MRNNTDVIVADPEDDENRKVVPTAKEDFKLTSGKCQPKSEIVVLEYQLTPRIVTESEQESIIDSEGWVVGSRFNNPIDKPLVHLNAGREAIYNMSNFFSAEDNDSRSRLLMMQSEFNRNSNIGGTGQCFTKFSSVLTGIRQLHGLYGDDVVRSILNSTNTVQVFGAKDQETLRFVSGCMSETVMTFGELPKRVFK